MDNTLENGMDNKPYIAPQSYTGPFEPVPKREYTKAEYILLPCALLIGILFDRLVWNELWAGQEYMHIYWGAFWLGYLAVFCVFYWQRLRENRFLWYITACVALLCVWNFFYRVKNEEYAALTGLVIPGVLMAHAVILAGKYTIFHAGDIVRSWFLGWLLKPFTGLPAFFGSLGSLTFGGGKSIFSKVLIGVLVTLPLLCIIIPLLSSADQVFGYYVERIVENWDIAEFIGHSFVVVIVFALFYSFIWNMGFAKEKDSFGPVTWSVDIIISGVVLGIVSALYLLFCGIQFTYLFARAGLPAGLTYSEYAREGFAQTVIVCAINLALFGFFLRFGRKSTVLKGLLAALLALTAVMLVSGAIRLGLYINAYGLTWLRLLSGWFIVYLVAVILLCAARMLREKLPVFALCAIILLGWYLVLGYANPDGLVSVFNAAYGYGRAS
ncbi:MAG: DUF4173 domain-containing protein [Lachnospiraceae bacterium]|jgi:hypothetical protein|nr:DUF4173 domain-containing protein [Lachnospiraceae bacterium]